MAQVLVTGAATAGIGEAITRLICGQGVTVVGTYERDDVDSASSLSSELEGLQLHEVDHSSAESLSQFAQMVAGPLSGFVSAQAFFAMEDLEAFDGDLWQKSLAVNLTAPNLLIHALRSKFEEAASIVAVTSTEAFIGSFGASAYAATKAAVHNLVKTHANNLGKHAIRVNAVAPGWIGGVMDTDEVFNLSRRITPLGRLGAPEEVANVVDFLLSAKSSFVNGSVVTVDGGYTGVDTIAKYEADAAVAQG